MSTVSEFDVVEASIAELRNALESGAATAVGLVNAYLARIEAYDSGGVRLNSMVVLNPEARAEAAASDERRARGATLGSLDGIPYTAKDSFLVRGLTVAAGSPAFEHLVAQRDAFTIQRQGAGVEQRALRVHALARGDLGARQLAAGADHGRSGSAYSHHGRPARGP